MPAAPSSARKSTKGVTEYRILPRFRTVARSLSRRPRHVSEWYAVGAVTLLLLLKKEDGVRQTVALLQFDEDLVEPGVVLVGPIPGQHEHLTRLLANAGVVRCETLPGKEGAVIEVGGQMLVRADAVALDPAILVAVVA